MIYQRPTVGSLQQWADEVQDQSYTFENLLPYYKKSATFTEPKPVRGVETGFNAAAFSPSGGPLQVSYPNYAQPWSEYVKRGMNELGFPTVADFNSGELMGCQYCTHTIDPKNEKRDSSQTSFLNEAADQGLQNLRVFSLTMAKKILFDKNNKATGVRVTSNLLSYTLTAKKEVIVSAGAFQSPQLLMVSGIGPASQLDQFNIPMISELPGVGQNMQDHILFGPSYRVTIDTLNKILNNPVLLAAEFVRYTLNQTGPLTNPVADFIGWEKVPESMRAGLGDLDSYPADWPEVEYVSGAGYIGNLATPVASQPKDGYNYASILGLLVAPQSRGNVTLKSADANILPRISTAYLQSPTDQKVAVAAYKRMRQVFQTNTVKGILIGDEYYPGKQVETDEQILDLIKGSLQTVWHASSTCKMGLESDKMAVIDTHARVFGVTGLRVVDASSFPFLPPGHPQSTIYALAEKIADDIKNGN